MRSIQKILHPTDFSPAAESATELAIEIASKFGAELTLLHVYVLQVYVGPLGETYAMPAETVYKIQDAAERAMERIRQRATAAGVAVKMHSVDGVASDVIMTTAKTAGMDLIVMGTHGRTGIKHLLLGSIAEQIVRLAPCPVLTVRGSS